MKTLFYFTKRDKNGWEEGNGSWVRIKGDRKEIRCKIKMDMETVGDGKLWLMQTCSVIKSHYTQRDEIERRLWNDSDFVEDGEIVEIMIIDDNDERKTDTKTYKVHINGDYSDAGYFEEIA